DGHRCQLPTLKARREDVGILVAAILADSASGRSVQFTADAGIALASQAWPFNVRELVQRLRGALLTAEDGIIHSSLIERSKSTLTPSASRPAPSDPSRPLSPAQAKLKQQLLVKLEESQGNVAEVARQMGKARMQIQRWIRRFGIERSDFANK